MMKNNMVKSKRLVLLVLFVLVLAAAQSAAQDVDFYVAPNGGFSPANNQRTITLIDGSVIKATLNNGVHDMVQRTPAGGAIKIVMYNFDFAPIRDLLIERATRDGVQVKVLLDNAASWTDANVAKFIKAIKDAEQKARQAGNPFDFQMKVTNKKSFIHHHRVRTLDNGKVIFGTMHEKFGVIYPEKNGPPLHMFAGSSNISASSDDVYAENRIFIRNEPVVAQIYANQFARLWNLYGLRRAGTITPETVVPPAGDPPFEIIFNGEHVGSLLEYKYRRIDERIIELLDEVKPNSSVEIAMFSFTHFTIANKILEVAQKHRGTRFRLLFDHSMIQVSEERIGLMPPYLEGKIKELGLKNIEIRYKFRANAYGWNKETETIDLDHFRAYLLHHKVMVVNKEKIIFGSFNWSGSAEYRNFEDVIIMSSDTVYGQDVINRFLAEYDFLWNKPFVRRGGESYQPYVIDGDYGRELAGKICTTLGEWGPSKIRYLLDRFGPKTLNELIKKAGLDSGKLMKALGKTMNARLVKAVKRDDGRIVYQLSD